MWGTLLKSPNDTSNPCKGSVHSLNFFSSHHRQTKSVLCSAMGSTGHRSGIWSGAWTRARSALDRVGLPQHSLENRPNDTSDPCKGSVHLLIFSHCTTARLNQCCMGRTGHQSDIWSGAWTRPHGTLERVGLPQHSLEMFCNGVHPTAD